MEVTRTLHVVYDILAPCFVLLFTHLHMVKLRAIEDRLWPLGILMLDLGRLLLERLLQVVLGALSLDFLLEFELVLFQVVVCILNSLLLGQCGSHLAT